MGNKKKKSKPLGNFKVELSRLKPNSWNPNRMQAVLFEKLKKGLADVVKKTGRIPPVVCRPHPTEKGIFEIIDGYHRWKAYKELKFDVIDVVSLNVDDSTARILTGNLNYLRGERDPKKYAELLSELLNDGMTVPELEAILPEDEADITDIIATYGDSDAIRGLLDSDDKVGEKSKKELLDEDNVFVDLKFPVSISQSRIIQAEIDRIGKSLVGNNIEGRALEFMAVMSSQSDLPPDLVLPSERKKKEGLKGLKAKARERLNRLKSKEKVA